MWFLHRPELQVLFLSFSGAVLPGCPDLSYRFLHRWNWRWTIQTAEDSPGWLLIRHVCHLNLSHHHIGTVCRQGVSTDVIVSVAMSASYGPNDNHANYQRLSRLAPRTSCLSSRSFSSVCRQGVSTNVKVSVAMSAMGPMNRLCEVYCLPCWTHWLVVALASDFGGGGEGEGENVRRPKGEKSIQRVQTLAIFAIFMINLSDLI